MLAYHAAPLKPSGAGKRRSGSAKLTIPAEPRTEVLGSRVRRRDHIGGIRDVITGMPRLGVIGAGVDIGETRPAGGEIAIEPEPGKRLIGSAELDAVMMARPTGSGDGLVAAKCRLAVEIEHEKCRLDPEIRERLGSHPELVASRLGQQLRFLLGDRCRVACWKLISVASASTGVNTPRKSLL